MITWWMKRGGNLPSRHDRCPTLYIDALLFTIVAGGILLCPVAQTRLDIPKPSYIYPVNDHWVLRPKGDSKADLSIHSRTRQPPDHDGRPKSEDQFYPGSSTGGSSPYWGGGGVDCENSPAMHVYRPPPAKLEQIPFWLLVSITNNGVW